MYKYFDSVIVLDKRELVISPEFSWIFEFTSSSNHLLTLYLFSDKSLLSNNA
jgi:hypothetical protein